MNGYESAMIPQAPLMLTLCLEEESILVSSAVLECLGHPRQIQMLINDKNRMLLLRACTMDDKEAIIIPAYPMMQFEMSGYSLLKRIRRLTDWPDMQPRVIYGDAVPQYQVVMFDLNKAQPAQLQIPQEPDRPLN